MMLRSAARRPAGGVAARVAGEDEVGGGRQHLEAERAELGGEGSRLAITWRRGSRMGLVVHRGAGAHQGQAIQRVGVEAVLDPGEGLDELRLADRKAHPQPGQRALLDSVWVTRMLGNCCTSATAVGITSRPPKST
jgi:hypothetical protein